MYKRGSISHSCIVLLACVRGGRADSRSRETIKGLIFALFSGKGTPLVSNETAGRLMGAGTLSTFLSSESAPEFSAIILPEKPLLSTLAQLALLDERFSFGTAAFTDAGSTFWSLMAVHLTP